MDKVVFDTLGPEVSCFDSPPANPLQQDACKITASFHNREDPASPQPTISFQREKDHYILDPSMNPSALAVLQGLGFNDKNPAVQGALHFSVFINGIHRKFYPSFRSTFKYNGPDLTPISKKINDFISVGDIDSPDEKQRKATADLMREILPSQNPEQDWFLRPLKFLLNEPISSDEGPSEKPMVIPVPMRPRIQWMRDQFRVYEDLRSPFTNVQDPNLKKKWEGAALSLLIYLNTGEGSLKNLKDDLDSAAGALFSLAPNAAPIDLFKIFSTKLEAYAKNPFFEKNPDARRRKDYFLATFKEAASDHRAELLGLNPEAAYGQSLKYRLVEEAESGRLALSVKSEMEDAGLSNSWLKAHVEELAETVLPSLTLVQEIGKPPRVKVAVSSLTARSDLLIQSHFSQTREYQIGLLAVLRSLFGNNLSSPKISGWLKDGVKPVEIDLSAEQSKIFFEFHDRLNARISKSIKKTSLALPLFEGGAAVVGGGLIALGRGLDQNQRTALNLTAPTLAGLGGGALLCHFIFKSRNQYLTDGLCGLAGAAIGLTIGFLTTSDAPPLQKTLPDYNGRNPVRGWGP